MSTVRSAITLLLLATGASTACSSAPETHDSSAASTAGTDVSNFERPDGAKTPGAVLTTDVTVISAPGYSATVRNVPTSEKKAVAESYQFTGASSEVEYDHLVSLEIGGSNDPSNLWPQPIAQARVKDQLEDYLHRQVVAGKMSLTDAQSQIAQDWIGLYQRTLGASAGAGGNSAFNTRTVGLPEGNSSALGLRVGARCGTSLGPDCDADSNLYCDESAGKCASCKSYDAPDACADGSTPDMVPSFDGQGCVPTSCPCAAATDCTGAVPALSETCPDGTTQGAHFDCVTGSCQLKICEDNGGLASTTP